MKMTENEKSELLAALDLIDWLKLFDFLFSGLDFDVEAELQ